jgi:hypothetical protein
MKQYMLAVYGNEDDAPPAPEVMQAMYRDVEAFNAELRAAGIWVFAGGLCPPSTATVVRTPDDEILTTDGPFAETKEHIGGFWIIKAADLDAALAWAAKGSKACAGAVEVRPFQEETES